MAGPPPRRPRRTRPPPIPRCAPSCASWATSSSGTEQARPRRHRSLDVAERTQLAQRLGVRRTPVRRPGPELRRQLVAARAPCIERRSHAGDGGGVLCPTIPLLVRVRRLVEELHPIPVADQNLRALPETLEHPPTRTAAVLAD